MKYITLCALLFSTVYSQNCTSQGKTVEVEGFVMDNFCIDRGTLLDNPSVKSLENPEKHSLHCLLDIPMCITSKFALLKNIPGANPPYAVAYQLGEAGTKLTIDKATASRKAGKVSGYFAKVRGIDDNTKELKCVEFVSDLASTTNPTGGPQATPATSSARMESASKVESILLLGLSFLILAAKI